MVKMKNSDGKVSSVAQNKGWSSINDSGSSPPGELDSPVREDTEVSSSEDGEGSHNENLENAQNQMVLYDLSTNGLGNVVHAPEPLNSYPPPSSRKDLAKPLPTIGSFTVQCANCYQWRLIPSKEKYEEIRENITEKLFYCETAKEWRPDISCDVPGDLQQDNTRLWAIDKPNIARPPPGWQRLLRLRGEGSSRFADVYYVAPTGKRFRSMIEIQKYLADNPDLAAETDTSKISFLIPKPLQEDYVKKRPSGIKSSRPQDSGEVFCSQMKVCTAASPAEQANPLNSVILPPPDQLEHSTTSYETPPKKKRVKRSPKKLYS